MHRLRLVLAFFLGLVVLFLGSNCSAQATLPPESQVYANFFGTWTGSDHYKEEDGWHDAKIDLKITPDKRGMRFDYDYVDAGGKKHSRSTRFVTLSPFAEEVILQWRGDSKETYAAEGLSDFAKAGFGRFSFAGLWLDRTPSDLRCTFALEKDEFSYEWQSRSVGTPYRLTAVWKLKRVSTQTSTSP